MDILKDPIDSLINMAVLYESFIPDNEISTMNKLSQIRVLSDIAGRRLMDIKGDLEGRVNSAVSFEKKRGNARGCDTNNNLDSTTERWTESVVYKSLACATWTIKKEALARLCLYNLHGKIKGRFLVMVEKRDPLFSQLSLLLCIIVLLTGN